MVAMPESVPECGRCGSLLVTGGHRNAGCNLEPFVEKVKQSHAQRIDGIRVDAGQNRSNL
jgi:hypothetical protein